MPPMTGRVIAGRYILEQPIGRGAMGMVWRSHDQLLDREVAVKEVVLSASIGEDERKNAYQRTLREARTAARLSHRGVVTIYDVAEEDGRPWIVMELVPSRSLDQVLSSKGPMMPLRAGRVGQQLLAALAAAHAAGVLHRDVKPSNVLIATDRSGAGWDERAVLTDFGIAQFEGDPRLTQTGMVMGSPGFTAPERIRGGDATPASDLWSLGATIYAAVEGRGPYEQRGGAITTMSAIINEDAPIAPSAGRLGPLIAALLRRDPSTRPSALVAARMLSEILPLLSDRPAHPATVRSPYVPAPAVPVVSAVAEAPDGVDDAAADRGAVALAGVGAVGAADAMAADAVDAGGADEAVVAEVAAPAGPAASADPAASEAATSLDAVLEDLVSSGDGANPPAGPVAPPADLEEPPAQAEEPIARPAEPATKLGATEAEPEPTELSIPASSAPPQPKPKPTFTASTSDPAGQAGPSFSPSRPAPPAPPPPVPSSSTSRPTWRTDPPTTPAPAYGPGGPDGYYADSDAQYAGPAQPYPDLAQQYAPGTGGRAQRRPRRGRVAALAAAALVAAAAIGGGVAYALRDHTHSGTTNTTGNSNTANLPGSVTALDNPSSAVPAGWTTVKVSPSDAGTTAGFTIDMPPGWFRKGTGVRTYLYAPNGVQTMEIDLTRHTYANMVTEAEFIERQSVARGDFPYYKRASLRSVPIRGAAGAFWQFTWTPSDGVKTRADDILFIARTPAGSQSYALFFWAPTPGKDWSNKYLPVFEKMLSTFQAVPA